MTPPSDPPRLLVPMFMDMNGWPEERAVRTYGFLMMGFSLVSTVMFVVTARLANRSGRGSVMGSTGQHAAAVRHVMVRIV